MTSFAYVPLSAARGNTAARVVVRDADGRGFVSGHETSLFYFAQNVTTKQRQADWRWGALSK